MDTYTYLAGQALLWILVLSLPPLLASLVVGLAVSLLQALTQVQEQTLTFVPKIIATILVLILFSGWMLETLVGLARHSFEMMLKVGAVG
jgi:flagellar biosynthetic protein FliQ